MIGDNIKKFRLLKGFSLRDLGAKVGVSQTAIKKYEDNILKPDGEKILKFAQVLGCSVGDLMKDIPNRRVINLNFRKNKKMSNKKVEMLCQIIDSLLNNYLDVLELNAIKNETIKKYNISSIDEVESVASMFRYDNNLNEKIPLVNLCDIIENLGIAVIILKNEDNYFNEFDGLSEIVDNVPFICIAADKNYYRQRFTLAHELAHLVLNIEEGLDKELVCNKFAGCLLLPKKAMEMEFGKKRFAIGDREFEIVRDEYKISWKAIVKRLEECEIITKNYAKIAYITFNKNELKKENAMAEKLIEVSNKYEQLVLRLLNQEMITKSRFDELMSSCM